MANTPASGIYYPAGTTGANLATILSDVATSIDGRVVSTFASTSARDTAFSGLTTSQRAGAKVYVSGVGWQGYNASSGSYDSSKWVAEERVKGGRVDVPAIGVIGLARIEAALCFFQGQAPSSVVVTSAMGDPAWTFSFAGYDGTGALIRVYNPVSNSLLPVGGSCAFTWLAFR